MTVPTVLLHAQENCIQWNAFARWYRYETRLLDQGINQEGIGAGDDSDRYFYRNL